MIDLLLILLVSKLLLHILHGLLLAVIIIFTSTNHFSINFRTPPLTITRLCNLNFTLVALDQLLSTFFFILLYPYMLALV